MLKPTILGLLPVVFAIYIPTCAKPIKPTVEPKDVKMSELWEEPTDLESRNLYEGPWGSKRAPDPTAVYTYVGRKDHGTNPGVTVTDPHGREWHVKQPPHNDEGAEGPIEVTLSRVLSAVGYHQPPVYYMPTFTMKEGETTHPEPGGRFRLDEKGFKKIGDWSWQQNPFVGTKPYQGLIVILMMFNSSDIKNENNTLYQIKKSGEVVDHWYVVRDLGTALGETGRLHPHRGNPDMFEKHPYIIEIKHGFVKFEYHGWHQELVKDRITPADVRWASELMAKLSDTQWADAFRAGGYEPQLAQRFIKRLHEKIDYGLKLPADASAATARTASTSPANAGTMEAWAH
jgi:hypothetical protein